jgi:hypothetical protein
MVITINKINKITMASLNTKKKGHDMTLKIQVLAWDRQTNLAM